LANEATIVTFDAFIETAWNDHADHPRDVADRLAASIHIVENAEQIAPFARLTTHVFGEHLGQWDQGIAILESLRRGQAFDDGPTVTEALLRNVAVLRFARGDQDALAALSAEDRVSALATASSAFAGQGQFKEAIAAYAEAIRYAPADLSAKSPTIRALAIGGNNLAAALEGKQDRDPAEIRGMIEAAESGLQYWKLAGTWLEQERAEYRLTRSLLQAGAAAAAVRSARRCVAVCEDNNAPEFELFFGHAVLALALRAAGDADGFTAARWHALEMYERVATDERPWCKAELAELDR
jgi:tetratricopeptide (TPR) repeat protein